MINMNPNNIKQDASDKKILVSAGLRLLGIFGLLAGFLALTAKPDSSQNIQGTPKLERPNSPEDQTSMPAPPTRTASPESKPFWADRVFPGG
jgi:hypothetical protein